MNGETPLEQAAQRVVELESELESAGDATTGGDDLARLKAGLHAWVDTVVAVVASPGVGRVALIHADGRQSSISSPDLPFRLSRPAAFGGAE